MKLSCGSVFLFECPSSFLATHTPRTEGNKTQFKVPPPLLLSPDRSKKRQREKTRKRRQDNKTFCEEKDGKEGKPGVFRRNIFRSFQTSSPPVIFVAFKRGLGGEIGQDLPSPFQKRFGRVKMPWTKAKGKSICLSAEKSSDKRYPSNEKKRRQKEREIASGKRFPFSLHYITSSRGRRENNCVHMGGK